MLIENGAMCTAVEKQLCNKRQNNMSIKEGKQTMKDVRIKRTTLIKHHHRNVCIVKQN